MNFSGIISRLGAISQDLEFLLVFSFLVFYPSKESLSYYLIVSFLMVIFMIKMLLLNKNFPISPFSRGIIFFNIMMVLSIFFSHFVFKSLHFFVDIVVISLYFILSSRYHIQPKRCFNGILFIITLFSLINVLLSSGTTVFFFSNPIMMGVVCGTGAVIAFYLLLDGGEKYHVIFVLVNIIGVFVSGSKAAFLGVILFFTVMAVKKSPKLLWGVLGLVIFTILVPNPIRRMIHTAIYKDPFALNRIQIWKMSLNIFGDYPLAGIGLENFSECSKQYNFRQKKGLAQYYKIPNKTHNDILKLLSETGLFGVISVLLFAFFLIPKWFHPPKNRLSMILLLFLVFQSMLFNILFHPLFFFFLLFLIKDISKPKETYFHLNNFGKWTSVLFLLFIFITGNVSPFLSKILYLKARKSDHIITASRYLKVSEFFNPFNIQTLYYRTLLLRSHFKNTAQIDSMIGALHNLKKIQRINRYHIDAYLMESDLFRGLIKGGTVPDDLKRDILRPLMQAEFYHPKYPFIKLQMAEIYFKSGNAVLAKQAAVAALELEPEYVGAMVFLQQKFQYFSDWETVKARIHEIQAKGEKMRLKPGSYLHALFKNPGYPDPG